jgi:hypothetical protein
MLQKKCQKRSKTLQNCCTWHERLRNAATKRPRTGLNQAATLRDPPTHLGDGAHVAAAPVGEAHGPVEARGAEARRVDVARRVEGARLELRRQQLA